MNIEQVEGQLAELKGKPVLVILPVRGTVVQTFFGNLDIGHDWENHIILYSIKFYSSAEINFQAQDIQKIIPHPNEIQDATIILKGDTWLEQSRYHHA